MTNHQPGRRTNMSRQPTAANHPTAMVGNPAAPLVVTAAHIAPTSPSAASESLPHGDITLSTKLSSTQVVMGSPHSIPHPGGGNPAIMTALMIAAMPLQHDTTPRTHVHKGDIPPLLTADGTNHPSCDPSVEGVSTSPSVAPTPTYVALLDKIITLHQENEYLWADLPK